MLDRSPLHRQRRDGGDVLLGRLHLHGGDRHGVPPGTSQVQVDRLTQSWRGGGQDRRRHRAGGAGRRRRRRHRGVRTRGGRRRGGGPVHDGPRHQAVKVRPDRPRSVAQHQGAPRHPGRSRRAGQSRHRDREPGPWHLAVLCHVPSGQHHRPCPRLRRHGTIDRGVHPDDRGTTDRTRRAREHRPLRAPVHPVDRGHRILTSTAARRGVPGTLRERRRGPPLDSPSRTCDGRRQFDHHLLPGRRAVPQGLGGPRCGHPARRPLGPRRPPPPWDDRAGRRRHARRGRGPRRTGPRNTQGMVGRPRRGSSNSGLRRVLQCPHVPSA